MSPRASTRWTCFRTVLSADAPIHIGWHDLGMVQRTRYYIPTRNIWGVLVAGLGPRLARGNSGQEIYVDAAKAAASLRFTCFFPTDGREPGEAWLPRYGAQGFFMGGKTGAAFEHEFVFSQTSAALDASNLTAEDGALHESEFLSPLGRTRIPLSFLGYIFIRDDLNHVPVSDTLQICWVGADRRYGWGRLRRQMFAKDEADVLFGGFRILDWDEKSGPIIIIEKAGTALPAHVKAAGAERFFEGELEAVSGREWVSTGNEDAAGSGQKVVTPELCWAPGSRSTEEACTAEFCIDAKGIWAVRDSQKSAT